MSYREGRSVAPLKSSSFFATHGEHVDSATSHVQAVITHHNAARNRKKEGMMNRRVLASMTALVLSLTAACGNGADSPQASTIRLTLSTGQPSVGQAAYSSLPVALGYWKENGIDVEINGLSGSSAALQSVVSGQSDVAVVGTSALMLAQAAGTDVQAYYTLTTRSFQNPAVPEDSDITSIADLQDKKIGVQSLESGTIPIIRGLVDSEGGDGSNLDFVAIGLGAEALSALQAGRVDALGLWDDRYAEIENRGEPLRVLENDLSKQLGFQAVLGVAPKWLEGNRETAIDFARGIAMASRFATENPEEAVRLHWEIYPSSKPVGLSEDEALEQGVRALTARMANSQAVDGLWGYSTDEQVESFTNLLIDSGAVPKSVQPKRLWNGSLIKEINDFDAAILDGSSAGK